MFRTQVGAPTREHREDVAVAATRSLTMTTDPIRKHPTFTIAKILVMLVYCHLTVNLRRAK